MLAMSFLLYQEHLKLNVVRFQLWLKAWSYCTSHVQSPPIDLETRMDHGQIDFIQRKLVRFRKFLGLLSVLVYGHYECGQ